MGFSSNQLRALRRDVDRRNLRTRRLQNGRALTYIEGWHAVAEANRIFGFGSWDRETVESRCILARELRGVFTALYAARVRITVRTNAETVIREGHGTGEGKGEHPGEAHDMAIKTAETDATKRALATFGKPFGLSLYLSSRKSRDETVQHNAGHSDKTRSSNAQDGRTDPGAPGDDKTRSPGPQDNGTRHPTDQDRRVTNGAMEETTSVPSSPALASTLELTPDGSPLRHYASGKPDHQRRRTLQRLGPNGRFYVPVPTQPTSDDLHAVAAAPAAKSKGEAGEVEDGGEARGDGKAREIGDGGETQLSSAGASLAPTARQASEGTIAPRDDGSQQGKTDLGSALGKTQGHATTKNTSDDIRQTLTEETAFLIAHPRRIRDRAHLAFVSTQACLLCGRTPSDAHHLKYAQPRAMSRKVSDEFTVPLCRTHHRQLHQSGGEAAWWNDIGIDPLPIAQELWQQSRGRSDGDSTAPTINDHSSAPASHLGGKITV